jgi:D-alanine-D-alanine ligase
MTRVLVLGGGPDAEREVSIASATGVHAALAQAGLDATLEIVDRPTPDEIRSWDHDVIFPVLHGRFGEGGTLQRLLQDEGKRFVGSGSRASRLAMDKLATKLEAARLGIPTLPCSLLDPDDVQCPYEGPVVIKPVADGSSCGLYLCPDEPSWSKALADIRATRAQHPDRVSMIEPMVSGRELTVGIVDDGAGSLMALPIIDIAPASGVYDYQAKYERSDTIYTVSPDLADDIARSLGRWSLALCGALGIRHLARVDFMMDTSGNVNLLECNTMPGFTRTSLLPKAAAHAGMDMNTLCAHLVRCAQRE